MYTLTELDQLIHICKHERLPLPYGIVLPGADFREIHAKITALFGPGHPFDVSPPWVVESLMFRGVRVFNKDYLDCLQETSDE